LLEMQEIDLVAVGAPNDVHCQVTVAAAAPPASISCWKSRCA
jgi:predicted dehydrogenase